MVKAISTYDSIKAPAIVKPVLGSVCTAMFVISMISGNATELKFNTPQTYAPTYSIESPAYNIGSTNLFLSGSSVMSEQLWNSLLRLKEIAALQYNWNGNGAEPFSSTIIGKARELINGLSIQPIILPTGRDSIQMEYENSVGDYLEFELFENGKLKMFSYSHDRKSHTAEIEADAVDKVVCDFYGYTI